VSSGHRRERTDAPRSRCCSMLQASAGAEDPAPPSAGSGLAPAGEKEKTRRRCRLSTLHQISSRFVPSERARRKGPADGAPPRPCSAWRRPLSHSTPALPRCASRTAAPARRREEREREGGGCSGARGRRSPAGAER
jgi:hypothetical protein